MASAAPAGPAYTYRGEVLDVVDGDTIRVEIDLGCDTFVRGTLRLSGIAAPETSTEAGKAAKAFLAAVFGPGTRHVVIETFKDRREKYGRYFGRVWLGPECVNDVVVNAGHAVPWDGKGKQPS